MMVKKGVFVRRKGTGDRFLKFIDVVRRLRNECPWDREQTHNTIRHSLIEETYEVIEAIDNNDMDELKRELGDLLLHIVLHAIMAEEENSFTMDDIIEAISEKMIRRHPHVFGNAVVENSHQVKRNWEHIKMTEGRISVLDGLPKKMPALLLAMRTQEKASKVGFDWRKKSDVWKKVKEELQEFTKAEQSKNQYRIEDEYGDVLFSLVNYSRFLGINPEFALKKSIEKFTQRFQHIESVLRRRNKLWGDVSLKEMDEIWNKRKKTRES